MTYEVETWQGELYLVGTDLVQVRGGVLRGRWIFDPENNKAVRIISSVREGRILEARPKNHSKRQYLEGFAFLRFGPIYSFRAENE